MLILRERLAYKATAVNTCGQSPWYKSIQAMLNWDSKLNPARCVMPHLVQVAMVIVVVMVVAAVVAALELIKRF